MNQIIISKLDNGNYMVQTPVTPKGIQIEQVRNVITMVREGLNHLKLPEPPKPIASIRNIG